MARPPRLELPNALDPVTSRGDWRENIYEDDDDRLRFLEILGTVGVDGNCFCHGSCLMDNHYHLISETLAKGMRQLTGVSPQAANRRHGRRGHLFQGRHQAILVDKDRSLLERSRYVVLNPLRAKDLVTRLEDWPWSRYLTMTGDAPSPAWFITDWRLSLVGKRKKLARDRYRQFGLEGGLHDYSKPGPSSGDSRYF